MIIMSKDDYDRVYRKIHAMYMKGYTYDEMYRECGDLEKWQVIEIVQTIYGREQMRKEKQESASSKEGDGHEVYEQRRLRKKNRSDV